MNDNPCDENRAKIDDFIAIFGSIDRPNLGDFGDMGIVT
jgi:hypothetical protein